MTLGRAVMLGLGEKLDVGAGGELAGEVVGAGESVGAGVEVHATTSATTPVTTEWMNRI